METIPHCMINFQQVMLLTVLFVFVFNTNFAQSDNYAKIKVELTSAEQMTHLNTLAIDFDHFQIADENSLKFIVNQLDLPVLDAANVSYEILIEDCRANYKEQQLLDKLSDKKAERTNFTADHFGYGSMGGFYTLAEIEAKLDEMSADFPNLASPKYSIGKSIEGRDIWAVKISDNPLIDEDEEVVYYDALHHAREPLSMAVTLNYAFWLLEHYAIDEKVKYMLNNREIYIVPCVNPDGYEYNRETDPNGGGFWRKNRRLISDDCVGIDLNRNYSFGYAHDNNCSSTNPCSNIYRGEEAFSEPESMAVKNFLAEIKPNTSLSIHSTAGSCLMPYGFDTSPPAFPIYSEWASDFLSENDYPYGVTFQMLGYTSCGTTRSYLHSEGVYCWTLEIDGSGFWPQQSEIFPLVDENVYVLFYQTWIAGQYTDVQSHQLIGEAVRGGNFEMNVEVKNKGLGSSPSMVEVSIVPNNEYVVVTGNGSIGMVASRERDRSGNFNIYIDPMFEGEQFEVDLIVSQNGTEMNRETIIVPIGKKTILFEDDAEAGLDNWTSSGNGIAWGLCADDTYDGSFSFADSDNGNSASNTTNFFTINDWIDLSESNQPRLEFFSKWSFDNFQDQVALQILTSAEPLWTTLQTYTKSEAWHQEMIDLADYKGDRIKIRFELQTDPILSGDGFYIDKLSIIDYTCVDCIISDIVEVESPVHLFYPNPFSEYLYIALKENIKAEINVYDLNGKKVKELILPEMSNTVQLNLSDLLSSVYMMQIIDLNSGATFSDKIIKANIH